MVNIYYINKSIENAIHKCKATEKAKNIGKSCIVTTETNERGYNNHIFTYKDGTRILFDEDYNLKDIQFNNTDYDYYGEKSYTEFDYQKRLLETTVDGEEPTPFQKEVGIVSDWEYLLEFADDFATIHGWLINNELRDNKNIDSENYDNSWLTETDALADHEWFTNVQNKTLCDHDNYCALRITTDIHENEDLNKRIITEKGHYCTSVGADMDSLTRNFGNDNESFKESFYDSWKTITLIKKDSGIHGIFFGTAINEGRHADSTVISDWEAELNLPPNMKFERLIIDEKNKIIIQTPKV